MIEEVLELCQEATPPSCYRREKGEERRSGLGGRERGWEGAREGGGSICISFHRNVGQGFGVRANWGEEGGGGTEGGFF